MSDKTEGTFVPEQEKRRGIEVLNLPEVRVSSASFARIRDSQGRYALLVNKNRAKKGDILLTPIGGAIETTEEGLQTLQQLLEIEKIAFEKGNDLRFRMPGKKANEFRAWFLQRQQRETNPIREVVEELVDEAELLKREDLGELQCGLVGFDAELEETTRIGQEGQMTLRLLEIFEAGLKAEIITKLEELSNQPNAVIYFVTAEEIQAGQTNDGIKISKSSNSLLNPKKTIEPFI
ncbi:MAG: hypothetical protein PHW01_02525 [Patescibacteria group bacterium]|nr:hypothetical protein [Patescibacteria group bacterium]